MREERVRKSRIGKKDRVPWLLSKRKNSWAWSRDGARSPSASALLRTASAWVAPASPPG